MRTFSSARKIERQKVDQGSTLICRFLAVLLILSGATTAQSPGATKDEHQPGLKPILNYISGAWDELTRSMTDCRSIVDPKIQASPVLYLPKELAEPPAVEALQKKCNVRVEPLPAEIQRLGKFDSSNFQPQGLLYLPNKYVVPGGRFNEMYGWDSYFIIRGLLRAGHFELARGMVENFLFEIEHYGALLNANRTYYLTRSQPPFLSSMVVELYQAMRQGSQGQETNQREWLERAYTDLNKDHAMWTRVPHLAGETGLSRYYDFGEGPPPEAVKDETGFYRKVADYFFFHPAEADGYVLATSGQAKQDRSGRPASDRPSDRLFTLSVCGGPRASSSPECEPAREFELSQDYYTGDRSMRESGFDVSFRFGPFGASTHHYAPVCLNSLLYKTEKDLEQIGRWLGRGEEAKQWSRRAEARKQLINRYLWNDDQGLFFDFNFVTKRMSHYQYATTFYPLWVGLATPAQAKAVAAKLKIFDQPGGVAMSTTDSGAQWDLPYGWGNIEMLAVEGLRRYGYKAEADRISYEFLSMVAENFRRDGNIREKYNVVTRSSEAHAELGYSMNVVGFGWTNAAFLELLDELPKELLEQLEKQPTQTPSN
jgi:alpha,alpha-trehalase